MGATDNTCNVCQQPCNSFLDCQHKMCIECILKIQDRFKVTCPTCQKINETESLLFSCYKCPRCSILTSEFFLCKTCDNYLCATCWKDIHSFHPIDQHQKDQRDDSHQRLICKQLHDAKFLDTEINLKLTQLENSTNATSFRQTQINQIRNRFDALREELTKQETAAILYVHDLADTEMEKLEQQKQQVSAYTTQCVNSFFDKHASVREDLPTVNYKIGFGLHIDENYEIPTIITTEHAPVSPDLITGSGKFIPKITGPALVVCVGGGGSGGIGGTNHRGGGGSGYITVARKFLFVHEPIDVEIGCGGKNEAPNLAAHDGLPTKFGKIIAKGGTGYRSDEYAGSGGSGGAPGRTSWDPSSVGGQGGSGGSDGESNLQWTGGKGYCSKEFDILKAYGVVAGAGGEGGKHTKFNNPSGGGAGGVVFGNVQIKAEDGTGEPGVGQGFGGIGFGAGGGGGGYTTDTIPNCKTGGDGANGCVIVFYE